MNFSQNLVFLRKEKNMTQEELAEALAVSRQAVSKWESGSAFPEMEKLLQICELFSVDLDSLARGDVKKLSHKDTAFYDRHMNRFTLAICGGVFTVLFGVFVLLLLSGLEVDPIRSTMFFMLFVTAAACIFIIAGLRHADFLKRRLQPFYRPEEIQAFERKFPYFIVIPTAMILLGVIYIIAFAAGQTPQGFSPEAWESFYVSFFLLLIAFAVPLYIYGGMQKAKYDTEACLKESIPSKEKQAEDKWSGIIMLSATALFLFAGFVYQLWHIAWVVFPLGGILCAIVSLLVKK